MSSIRSRAPAASSDAVRRVMQAIPGMDTQAETRLRSALFRRGLRFRKNCRPITSLRISADIVFPRQRVCIFVDGCYWHGCEVHFRPPRSNAAWWIEKVNDNRTRDLKQTAILREHGWRVIRLWEHEVLSEDIERLTRRIERCIRGLCAV
jgi:DNA mismatch endonuclease (patch repair protein)